LEINRCFWTLATALCEELIRIVIAFDKCQIIKTKVFSGHDLMNFGIPLRTLSIIILISLLCACQSAAVRTEPETVSIQASDTTEGMTREQLDSAVRRFAQSYSSLLARFYEEVRVSRDLTPEQRRRVINYQVASTTAAVGIAMGNNPVTNLLDMMVLASLGRMEAEKASTMGFYNEDQVADLQRVTRKLEQNIWNVSNDVLTTQQQALLKARIEAWAEEHPDFSYFFRVRFSEFAGIETGGLGDVERTGGLLSQFGRTLDEVEEVRLLGERLMFYLDFAPYLTSMRAEQVLYDLLQQPELQQTLDSTNRFVLAVERLPDARFEAINQMLAGIAMERKALFNDIVNQQSTISQTLSDFRPVLESASVMATHLNEMTQSLERTATAVNLDLGGPAGEPIDIVAYQRLVTESATTLKELRLLVETLARTQLVNQHLPPTVDVIQDEINDAVLRIFLLTMLTIVVFFVALYLYRRATHNYGHVREQ